MDPTATPIPTESFTPSEIPPAMAPTTASPTPQQNPSSISPIEPKKNNLILYVVIIVFLIILVAVGGFLVYKNYSAGKNNVSYTPVPQATIVYTTSPTIAATADLTADWKTYTNTKPSYLIRYPTDWTIDNSKAESTGDPNEQLALKISKNNYQITISWPSAYGPSGCIFSDNPDFAKNISQPIGPCPGEFVEFKSVDKIYRRLKDPLIPEGGNPVWGIMSKENQSGYFVGVPPINYNAPVSYDPSVILVMDQILSTFKVTN